MFDQSQKMAIYMEASLNTDYSKMGYGVMRYTKHPVACVIDSEHKGKSVREASGQPFDVPVVGTIQEASELGAEIMVLGIAPSGGKFPDEWNAPMEQSLQLGMSLINGLHDDLNERFGHLLKGEHQKIWDVRKPTFAPPIGKARAAEINNKRVLMVGTDMAAGKMTTGLELYKWLTKQDVKTGFIATGQIGITVTGSGIPLDAIKVDQAAGSVEAMVLGEKDKDVVIIEGQGSLLHPGSTATLPLLRGSCATHLVLCHRAKMTTLKNPTHVQIPPLKEFIALNEALAGVCGSLTQAKTIGVALNTYGMTDEEASRKIKEVEDETGIPTTDVIRYGPEKIGNFFIN